MISEEQAFQDMPAIDQLRVPSPRVGPEQAAANRKQNARDLLSIVPGPGNVIAAEDAVQAFGDAGRYRAEGKGGKAMGSAALGMLSAFGAVTGFPTSRLAGNAARGAGSRTNIFAGPMAKTADHDALARAQEMQAAGVGRDAIHAQTGWHQGVDGKWRFEIDDSGAALAGVKPPQSANHTSTFDDVSHPKYKAAYGSFEPHEQPFSDYRPREISGTFDPRAAQQGQYYPVSQSIYAQGKSEKDALGVSLHEMQHHTQSLEDFAPGANVSNELARLPTNTGNSIVEQLRKSIAAGEHGEPGSKTFADAYKQLTALEGTLNEGRAIDLYRRSAGEVEARNVQTRMNMTAAERRAKAPWLTQDVPDEQQIIRRR